MSNEIFMVSTVRPWARPATFELEPMAKSAISMLFMAATETIRSVISKMGPFQRHGIVYLPRRPSFEQDQSKGN